MWKRENEIGPPLAGAVPASAPIATGAPSAPRREPEPVPVARTADSGGRGVIGGSIVVRGEISGEEDLLVEGRVEGKIDLRQNAVTIGLKGQLVAEIHARAILIDGEVEGNLTAEEQIIVRKSGRVHGDLCAPRVTIEDGARFKGSIDMEPKRVVPPVSVPRAVPSPRPADPLAALGATSVGTAG